ncbi:MAG: hypothetical protein ACFFBM_12090 [Promethearchaeota archaeon]
MVESKESKYIEILLLMLLFVATAIAGILRFGTSFPAFPDSEEYLTLIDFFRGEVPMSETRPPFNYRILLPGIVSILPLDPEITIPIINFLLLFPLAFMMYLIPRHFGYDVFPSVVAAGLCTVSPPVLIYGTGVLVETPFVLCLAIGIYGILRSWKWQYIAVITAMGVLFKETAIILVLVHLVTTLVSGRDWKHSIYIGLIAGTPHLLARLAFSASVGGLGWVWPFSLNNLFVRPWITLEAIILSFVLIIVPILMALILRNRDVTRFKEAKEWFLYAALPLSGLAWVAFFLAYFDMRFIWPMYLGLLPLIAFGVQEFLHVALRRDVTAS